MHHATQHAAQHATHDTQHAGAMTRHCARTPRRQTALQTKSSRSPCPCGIRTGIGSPLATSTPELGSTAHVHTGTGLPPSVDRACLHAPRDGCTRNRRPGRPYRARSLPWPGAVGRRMPRWCCRVVPAWCSLHRWIVRMNANGVVSRQARPSPAAGPCSVRLQRPAAASGAASAQPPRRSLFR